MNSVEEVKAHYDQIRNQLPDKVRVIAVTKGFDQTAIETAKMAGFADVGENYAQEAAGKHESLGDYGVSWHFIGQLQRNKVKLLAPFVTYWHTVDNEALAKEIAKRAPGAKVFIQINMTDDSGRGGCEWDEVEYLVKQAQADKLNVVGLMAVAPQADDETVRTNFKRLATMAADLGLKELSMGMSGDWQIAVEEGATMIRLGSSLFGPREPRG